MKFMNEYEVDDAFRLHYYDPVLGPATRTLKRLVEVANANSDGWAYWPKPARSARQLMELIESADRRSSGPMPSAQQVRKSYGPIKAMLTRTGLTMTFENPESPTEGNQ